MRVSIVAPVYNAERYIERCIRSALAQTFEDWELLIVDDGSTDATPDIVRRFTDARIRFISLPHRGIAKLDETYNTALAHARGDLVAVLEGDDEWPADKLALQVPAFDESDVVITWGRGMMIDGESRPSQHWPVHPHYRRDLDMAELFRVLARWNVLSPAVTVMLRKSALDAIGGFQMAGSSLFVDLPTWLLVAATARGRARYIDADLGLYRTHTTNTGLVHNSKMRLEHNVVFTAVQERIGPEGLRKLGWTDADARRTAASASLTRGVAALQDGDYRGAQAAFRSSMRNTRTGAEFVKALGGYTSALLHVDFISAAIGLRYGQLPRLLGMRR